MSQSHAIHEVKGESSLSLSGASSSKPEFQHENISVITNPMVQKRIVKEIADAAHESWKKEHFQLRGAGAPRWKTTNDAEWLAQYRAEAEKGNSSRVRINQGNVEVNIAAFSCGELPADRQGESVATGEVVAGELRKAVIEGRALDSVFIREAADTVHKEWLKRNGQWADPIQKKSFKELVEVAQSTGLESERRCARINLIMDIQYVTEGIKALMMEQTLQDLKIAA